MLEKFQSFVNFDVVLQVSTAEVAVDTWYQGEGAFFLDLIICNCISQVP